MRFQHSILPYGEHLRVNTNGLHRKSARTAWHGPCTIYKAGTGLHHASFLDPSKSCFIAANRVQREREHLEFTGSARLETRTTTATPAPARHLEVSKDRSCGGSLVPYFRFPLTAWGPVRRDPGLEQKQSRLCLLALVLGAGSV